MENKLRKIRRVATRVRRYMEQVAREDRFCPIGLGGLCGRAASILQAELVRNNIPAKIVHVSGHAFVKCGNYVVDVTSSQFRDDMPNVSVRRAEKIPKSWWWWRAVPNNIYDNPKDWIKQQKKDGWEIGRTIATRADFKRVQEF